MKSSIFEVILLDKYGTSLPKKHVAAFVEANGKRAKITASYNKKSIQFYAHLKKEATGDYRIFFSKAKRDELNVEVGDFVLFQLFKDESKYGVEVPEALDAVLLSDYDAFQIFEKLTPGKQRSIIYAIKRIKNVQTQVDKSIVMTQNLKRGITDNKLLFKSN